MKNLSIFFTLLFLFSNLNAQNLVPNPSFEEYSRCPDSISQIRLADGWFAANITPDYYNSCFVSDSIGVSKTGVPNNYFGVQEARTGNAYAGAFMYVKKDIREAIGIKLSEALIPGTRYYVSFYVNLADKKHNCRLNRIGMAFANTEYRFTFNDGNYIPINNQAKVYSDSIITDIDNWTKIDGSFISDSNYTYLYVGNFFSDSLISTNAPEKGNPYFYIEDVCISSDPAICGLVALKNNETEEVKINTFPNPFGSELNFKMYDSGISVLTLYNLSYMPVIRQIFTNNIQLNTSELPAGVYFFEVSNSKGLVRLGKVVKL